MAPRSRGETITALRDLLALFTRFSGLGWLIRTVVARRRVSIVMYHDPDPARLDRQLGWLAKAYSPVSADQVVVAIRSGSLRGLPPRSVVVHLDDGRARNAELLETFERHRIRPAIFLVTERVGSPGALSEADIERMRMACAFESHTLTHPHLPDCDEGTARREIAASRQRVEALTGAPCRHLAYPAGRYGDREARLAAEAGYDSARTIDIGWNTARTDPHRLRILCTDPPSVTLLAAELAGLQWLGRLVRGQGSLGGRRRHPGRLGS